MLIILTGCDPVHDILLENNTDETIDVIYQPHLNKIPLNGNHPENFNFQGEEMNKVTLQTNDAIIIGTVAARYNPSPNDIDLDYLEIRHRQDTIRLMGKDKIMTAIHKVEKLDWRLIIK
ncbi:hypothetical protein MY04_1219 [Flammeovirga sp. MY04]|uniref:hypothetical protein n=1 Tax=Flammeovirga sp. MY04 TaxID=1191459 RepID=UPI0013053C8E|nr:hypothetical protein [Flammeovirga sp. MY04]ANQ48596.2 hypothetical protein MY04_1219 [Flammeovirga sp. MY04]